LGCQIYFVLSRMKRRLQLIEVHAGLRIGGGDDGRVVKVGAIGVVPG
jgi:hypothetical protein